MKHPEKVLKDHGIEVPKGHQINIYEDTESTTHLILSNDSNLHSEELKKIYGGKKGWGGGGPTGMNGEAFD